jgi:hypothetical protein
MEELAARGQARQGEGDVVEIAGRRGPAIAGV